jgi:PAS domain S-box-containing protein
MSEPSDPNVEMNELRDQIIGLGARSIRKSYYPQLQQQIDELKKAKAALEEKSDSLHRTLHDLEAARQRAEESERKFRTLFEEISDGVVVVDLKTQQFLKINPAFCQMLGYSEAELLSLSISDIHPPEEMPHLQEEIAKLHYGKPSLIKNLRYQHKNGSVFYAEINATAIDLDNRRCSLAVFRDMTEHKRAEDELHRLNRLYAVLSQVNQAMVHASSHEELLKQVCEISIKFGGFKMTWVGKINPETHQVIPVAAAGTYQGFLDKVHVYADDRPEGRGTVGISLREERTCVTNDFLGFPGTLPWRELATHFGFRAIVSLPLRNAGEIYGALVVYADELDFFQDKEVQLLEEVATSVSFALDHIDQEVRRQQNEAALKLAKETAETANRAKDQFIAVLSHELRTPLTPVLTAVTLLRSHEKVSEELKEEMEIIHRNIELEARLIDDLLDVTRISRGIVELQHEEVDVHASLMKTLEICQSEISAKSIDVTLNLEARDHHVWADSARLQQVFWNLLKNAVKFTPSEGRITILTTNTDQRLKIVFSDTGIGIEPHVLPRIFNAFEQGEQTKTRRFGGLGLGLSIAKAVVELHNGRLTAASEGQNQGSVFTVELDPIATQPGHTVAEAAPAPRQDGQRKILLVEDHADTLRILSRLLQKWGYNVQCASSVATALELAAQESFDILVSDIGLPDGSGLDIMRQTKERYGLHGIALSGFGTDDDRRESREAGFDEHLTKPVGIECLRTAVERVLS